MLSTAKPAYPTLHQLALVVVDLWVAWDGWCPQPSSTGATYWYPGEEGILFCATPRTANEMCVRAVVSFFVY